MLDLSIVVPLFNEEGNIKVLVDQINENLKSFEYQYEIILVNDGSTDASWKLIKELSENIENNVVGIDLLGNYGQTIALRAGFKIAKGKVFIAMDGDLQHNPKYIPVFMEEIEKGVDLVSASKRSTPDSKLKQKLSKVAHFVISKLSGTKLKYSGATFKAYRRHLLDNITLMGDMHRFLGAIVIRKGITYKEIEIDIDERLNGTSSYKLSKTFMVLIDLIFVKFLVSYMTKPFRLFALLSASLSTLGIAISAHLFFGWIFYDFYITKDYLTEFVLAVFLFLTSFMMLGFGVLAEIGIYILYSKKINEPYNIREATNT